MTDEERQSPSETRQNLNDANESLKGAGINHYQDSHDPSDRQPQNPDLTADHPAAAKPNIATFRGIPKKVHDAIKQTASDLGIAPGELARYFLEVGLKRVAAGEEGVEPKYVSGGYTLYPDEKAKRARRKARRKSKILQTPRSYYGVPREVVKAVLERSRMIGVTQGELARYLFERGLERYQKGELILRPEPVQQIATLYPEDLGKS